MEAIKPLMELIENIVVVVYDYSWPLFILLFMLELIALQTRQLEHGIKGFYLLYLLAGILFIVTIYHYRGLPGANWQIGIWFHMLLPLPAMLALVPAVRPGRASIAALMLICYSPITGDVSDLWYQYALPLPNTFGTYTFALLTTELIWGGLVVIILYFCCLLSSWLWSKRSAA